MGKVVFRKWLRYFFLLAVLNVNSFINDSYCQVIISEVDPNGGGIEYRNISDAPVDLSIYKFRSGIYVFNGIPYILQPGEYISVAWIVQPSFSNNFGEHSIYLLNQYNADGYIDYVIWSDRDTITPALQFAVDAGVWDALDKYAPVVPTMDPSVPGLRTLSYLNYAARTGHETNSTTWGIAPKSGYDNALCDTQSFLLNKRSLSCDVIGYFDYESETILKSNQIIKSQSIVDYDSSVSILLEPGFEIESGATFEGLIDGCNIGLNGIH